MSNEKGERIELPFGTETGGKRTDDCIKCYIKDRYYWSPAFVQSDIIVNSILFGKWFELQPLNL